MSEDTAATFARDGVVCLRGAFDQTWVERLRLAIERRISEKKARTPVEQPIGFLLDVNMWDDDADFRSFAFESPAAEIAGTTVGAMKVRAHRGYEALRRLLGKPKKEAAA